MLFDQLKGRDAGLFYSTNGYTFGNLTGLVMKQGEPGPPAIIAT
jgi:hypothetical protein